jgi:hypothetical protein
LHNQVKMVAHQTIVVEAHPKTCFVAGNQFKEAAAIGVVGKDGFTIVAAIHEVVTAGGAVLVSAWCAGHRDLPQTGAAFVDGPVYPQTNCMQ